MLDEKPRSFLAHFNLKIGGRQATPQEMDALLECTIENSLHLPDVCTLRLYDGDFYWLDVDTFREGTAIEVFGGGEHHHPLLPLFSGEVTGMELDLTAHGVPTITVRCYDRSHRLQRGRQSRSFVQMTDADIVRQIGREAGFKVHAEETGEVHDWILQNNQSHWEFLLERAERNGYRLYVQGRDDLHFCKVQDEGKTTLTLEWGLNLRAFRPRVSAAAQVDEVIVRGWDPEAKKPIIGHCARPHGIPHTEESETGIATAHRAFGAARQIVVDRPVLTAREADDLARSLCDEIGAEYLVADGLCEGLPELKPDHRVQIEKIGKRFSGTYYVTTTTHIYSPAEGYATLFTVSGKKPDTVLGLLQNDRAYRRAPLGGNIVVAVVTENKDPKGWGRVKVVYPWLTEAHTSFWARTTSQMAGKGRGMFNLPEIGDEVLVAFEHGDIRRPYVLGQLWNGKDGLPSLTGNATHGPDSEINRRGFHTRIGHKLDFDDTGGAGSIQMTTANGHKVNVDDANKKIEIHTKGGQKVTLDDGDKSITIQDSGEDVIRMSEGMVSVTAMQMMTLAAPVINIAGAIAVNITGLTTSMIAGTLATVSGQLRATLDSRMQTVVHGGMSVEIHGNQTVEMLGDQSTDIKGNVVRLNS